MRLPFYVLFVGFVLVLSACAHSSSKPTGFPADVGERFFFHVNIEAIERGLRTSRAETGVTVYASAGQIAYGISGDEIIATYIVPNRSGKNANYYRQKQSELQTLSDALIEGARRRARDAQDFAY